MTDLGFLLNAIPIDLLSRGDRQSHIVASLKHPQNHGGQLTHFFPASWMLSEF
jgi:hypothetical protein